MTAEHNTQQLILDAALQEFHLHGFNGARTSRIATRAGISRTMLHYYFSTKEALFEAVLNKTFNAVLPHIQRVAQEGSDLFAMIETLVKVLSDMLEENPGLPSFVVNILNERPDLLLNLGYAQEENAPGLLEPLVEKARQNGQIRQDILAEDLVIHIWSLCTGPYLVSTYIAAKEKRNEEAMKAFIRRRRKAVLDLLIKGIQP